MNCASPHSYSDLNNGTHLFEVRFRPINFSGDPVLLPVNAFTWGDCGCL